MACRGGYPRSTACIPSTAAAPECCIARSTTPPTGLGADGHAVAPAVRQDVGAASMHCLRTSWGRCCGFPHHPLTLARFGAPDGASRFDPRQVVSYREARALFGGVAAHAFRPLHYPMTSAIGLGIITAGHRHGWPVAAGGFAVDHQRAGVAAGRSGRQDRDRHPDRGGLATAARRRDDVRPGTRSRRRYSR